MLALGVAMATRPKVRSAGIAVLILRKIASSMVLLLLFHLMKIVSSDKIDL